MNTAELVAAFEAGDIPATEFPHERHVEVAWGMAKKYGEEEGLGRFVVGIKAMASRAGRPEAYHATITRAWFDLIATVDQLAAAPELRDKTILNRYYSPERLSLGRAEWVEPDLHPLQLPVPSGDDETTDVRAIVRQIPTAVGVFATKTDDMVHATTVSSIASVSANPAIISVCLSNDSRALQQVRIANKFALSVLAADQGTVADKFASSDRPGGALQFKGIAHKLSSFGPLIDDAIVWMGCQVLAIHPSGDHQIVIGTIESGAIASTKEPLVRQGGLYFQARVTAV